MIADRPLLALTLASTLALAGCASLEGGPAAKEAAAMTVAPGTNATSPVVFEQAGVDPGNASLSVVDAGGFDVELPGELHGNDTGALAGWVSVSVPEDAQEAEREVVVSLEGPDGSVGRRAIPVTVATPSDPLSSGEIAMLQLTARTQDGALALTNNETVAKAPLPEAAGFRDPQQFRPIPVPLTPQGQLPTKLVQALVGAGVNHSLSVDVPNAFGPAKIEQKHPREETIQREVQIPVTLDLPPRRAQQVLPRDAQEGDEVGLPVVRNASQPVPYVITSMGRQKVSFELALEEGENLTLHKPWTHGANVTEKGDKQATLYVTPTHAEGETLTWVQPWGNTTTLLEVTNETITLRHNPEKGLTYTTPARQGRQPVETTVAEVTEDTIVLSQENPHPQGGKILTFDVTVVDRQQAPQRAPRGGAPSPR